MDCSTDLLAPGADYRSIRNELWRQVVPRSERHGMLCHHCIGERLGRPLTPGDMYQQDAAGEPGDPVCGPMTLDDYGILDELRVPALTPVDTYLLDQASSQPRKIRHLVLAALEDQSGSLPQVTDLFYLERLEYLIETGALDLVQDALEFLNVRVRSAASRT